MNLSPFGSVPVPKKGRTNFDLSHSVAGTFGLSDLQPVLFIDALPGSSYKINVFNISKLETLIAPAMQQVNASLLTFKIPKRLCYKNFKDWYSGGASGTSDAEKPHWNLYDLINSIKDLSSSWTTEVQKAFVEKTFGPGSLWNLLGLPIPLTYDSATGIWEIMPAEAFEIESGAIDLETSEYLDSGFIDAMPFIAYWLLHDEYFMDQTLGEKMFVTEGDLTINEHITYEFRYNGTLYYSNTVSDSVGNGGLLTLDDFLVLNRTFKRAWRKEYFTSALPTPQRGPEVTLDMFQGEQAEVVQNSPANLVSTTEESASLLINADTDNAIGSSDGKLDFNIESAQNPQKTGLSADLSGLSPITITAFRNLFKLQAFLEKNNVAGGRFIETILAHWGERVPDFTVQRPVHVRSTSIPIQISEVTAMSNSAGINSQLGDQGGRAKGMGNLGSFRVYTQEPAFIFSLYCVTVPPAYANQGIPRIFQHITRFDEPWTDFQHIGEQAIKNRELMFDWTADSNNYNQEDFGYQQRFSEYKYMPDRIVGDFQTSLAYWTMARIFKDLPYLNEDFVTHQPDERIFAVKAARPVTASFFFQIKAKLKLSRYSTPKLT